MLPSVHTQFIIFFKSLVTNQTGAYRQGEEWDSFLLRYAPVVLSRGLRGHSAGQLSRKVKAVARAGETRKEIPVLPAQGRKYGAHLFPDVQKKAYL